MNIVENQVTSEVRLLISPLPPQNEWANHPTNSSHLRHKSAQIYYMNIRIPHPLT